MRFSRSLIFSVVLVFVTNVTGVVMTEEEKEALLRFNYLPAENLPLNCQKPDVLLAMVVLGEAGGEPFEAKVGVACVARNRVLSSRWPNQWNKVLVQPIQFQGLMSVEQFYKTFDERTTFDNWMECLVAGQLVMFGNYVDVSNGSLFFVDYSGTKKLPGWLDWKQLRVKYGKLFFFRGKT